MESLLLSIPAAARVLGVGRTSMYGLIAAGEIQIQSVSINRRRLVVAASLREYVDRLTTAGNVCVEVDARGGGTS